MPCQRWSPWVWISCISLLLGLAAGPQLRGDEPAGHSLFDGKTLDGWDGNPKFWRVEDGTITGQTTAENPTQGNTFLIWRKGEVGDFELKLKFRIVGGNSGIQYRSKEGDKWVIGGYQADIDSTGQYAGILYEERGRGILAQRGQQVVIQENGKIEVTGKTGDSDAILSAIKKEDWNEYTVRAVGNHLIQTINGHVTVDVTDHDAAKRAMKGLLALQLHAGPPMIVQFKDIYLQPLNADGQAAASAESGKKKKVVFLAGRPSHAPGDHEHHAGCLLLGHYLKQNMPGYDVEVHREGWPTEGMSAFEGVDTVVVYCDGGEGHLLIPHRDDFQKVLDRGVGLVCLHYAVEVPKGDIGNLFVNWLGGYFEPHWSVNPHWTAKFAQLPDHPIARGVQPFEINDEWYFHMRFRPEMKGVQPILSAVPPASTMERPDGPHSGNPAVRQAVQRGDVQHVAWASERSDGGRAFGFTGGHVHWNWGDDNFRKVVLNAIVWTAHDDVPENGVGGPTPTREQLEANQDPKGQSSRPKQVSEQLAEKKKNAQSELSLSLQAR